MAEFVQGDTALWNNYTVKIDVVYTDGQTGQAFYQVSDPTGCLFRPAGYTFVGEAQLSSFRVPAIHVGSVPSAVGYQQGYDVLLQLYPLEAFIRVTASFPVRWFFAFNPVTAFHCVDGALIPFSRSFMSRQGTGEDVYEMAMIDLQEGDYLEIRLNAVVRVVFALAHGELMECAREGDVVVGIFSGALR